MTAQSSGYVPGAGPTLDGASANDLTRRWRASGAASEWRPDWSDSESAAEPTSLKSTLPYLLLPLGLLAIVAFIAGVRAAVDAGGDLEALQWLRIVMLGLASVIVAGQGWALFARTGSGQSIAAGLARLRSRLRQRRPWQPPPILDAVSVAELRRAASERLSDPAAWERVRRRARRTTAGATWWVLVALSLALSVGIAVLMSALITRELGDGRPAGGWMLLPGAALLIAVLVLHRERAVGPAQPHELGPLLGRQAVVASTLVEVGLTDPTVQGGLGDAQLRCDLADRSLTLPGELHGSPPELLGVGSGHLGLLPGDIVASCQVSGKPSQAPRELGIRSGAALAPQDRRVWDRTAVIRGRIR
jgi:hypothetical protein